MSLLMDALRKAELAKRQGSGSGVNTTAETEDTKDITLEPLIGQPEIGPDTSAADSSPGLVAAHAPASAPTISGTLPDLPAHLEKLDAEFLADAQLRATRSAGRASSTPRETPASTPHGHAMKDSVVKAVRHTSQQDQVAAQNVFAAKQTAVPVSRKNFTLAIGSATLLAIVAIGGYFWWQLQPKSGLTANPATPPVSARASAQPTTVPAPPSSLPSAATPTPYQAPSGSTATRELAASTNDNEEEGGQNITSMKAETRRDTARSRSDTVDEPVRLTRSPLRVDPALMRGFDAFNRGDLATARIEYERAIKSDPRNTDALHGLAAIALRQGQLDQAEWLYQRVLEANPQDPAAQAALINIKGQIDPVAAESRLKTLTATQPELAAPHFALGNLYARQGRWSEAQPAYFRAWNAEPDNPDILYNLAISLEHLHQIQLAAKYYGQAITAANARPASFDKMQAESRLRTLQP